MRDHAALALFMLATTIAAPAAAMTREGAGHAAARDPDARGDRLADGVGGGIAAGSRHADSTRLVAAGLRDDPNLRAALLDR